MVLTYKLPRICHFSDLKSFLFRPEHHRPIYRIYGNSFPVDFESKHDWFRVNELISELYLLRGLNCSGPIVELIQKKIIRKDNFT